MSVIEKAVEAPVTFTESAIKELIKIKEKENITENHGLRVGVNKDWESIINNKAKETLPTLPQYIKVIITSFDISFKSLVIPVDIPTVSIADKTSKTISVKSK